MKALTVLQPWAHAIAHLGKRLENRTWSFPPSLRDQVIAIHAGARSSLDVEALDFIADDLGLDRNQVLEAMSFGSVVAVAKLAGILRKRPAGPQARWWAGPLAWDLYEVVTLPSPVPCRGMQGLWSLPEDVFEAVVEQWSKGDER